jgi:hypothetical protein
MLIGLKKYSMLFLVRGNMRMYLVSSQDAYIDISKVGGFTEILMKAFFRDQVRNRSDWDILQRGPVAQFALGASSMNSQAQE